MVDALKKGHQLEEAVRAIEETILRQSPGLKEGAFRIESRKLIYADGVKHEIDLWVSVEIAKGYKSIFVFECKNWEDKVSKNEIIVFCEKIDVTSAQKGFFVAKSFTRDAVAQAAKDARIQLLTAEDLPTEMVEVPMQFHVIILEGSAIELAFKSRGIRPDQPVTRIKVMEVTLRGETMNIQELAKTFSEEAWQTRSCTFPSGTLPEGVYPVSAEGELLF